MASFNSFCFWVISSVFAGSSFRSLLTSLSDACVVFTDFSTPERAFWRPVLSPPIWTVMPRMDPRAIGCYLDSCMTAASGEAAGWMTDAHSV